MHGRRLVLNSAEAKELTWEQREARLELCEDLGEAAYNPELDPEDFLDPGAIVASRSANPYFPLIQGTGWVYYAYDEDGELAERITVRVMYGIKTIEYPEESGKFVRMHRCQRSGRRVGG